MIIMQDVSSKEQVQKKKSQFYDSILPEILKTK